MFVSFSVMSIFPVSPIWVVFMPVAPLLVSAVFLMFVCAPVPVMMLIVCVVSITTVISGRWSAAAAASLRGLAPQVPSSGGGPPSGVTGAPLQAGGAKGVEEEALISAPEWTLKPDRDMNKKAFNVTSLYGTWGRLSINNVSNSTTGHLCVKSSSYWFPLVLKTKITQNRYTQWTFSLLKLYLL